MQNTVKPKQQTRQRKKQEKSATNSQTTSVKEQF